MIRLPSTFPNLSIHPKHRSLSRSVYYNTYTWEFDAAVTAFWGRTLLLDVEVSKLAAGGLDHADLVRLGIVSIRNTIVNI
jgi:hypothetical protein